MIMINIYKDIHDTYSISYIVEKNNEFHDVYQFIKFHLEEWEVGQYMGGN